MRQARMAEDASSLHHIEPEEQDTEAPTDCRPKGMNEEGELLGRRVRNLLRVHHAAQGLNFTFGHWGKYTGDRENGAMRALVNECLLHPLTIKFAGRWLCLKRVTSGGRKGFDELIGEISVGLIGDDGSHNTNVLFALMNEAISPQISGHKTKIVRLCLTALVTVFYNESLTSVSKEVVNDFFLEVVENEKEIFSMDDRFYQSNGRRASMLVPEILGALGILNITNHTPVEGTTKKHTTVRIDHDLIRQFSQQILDDGSMHHLVREDAERRWNEAYVQSYSQQKSKYLWDDIRPDRTRKYALERMPSHMIRASMFDEVEASLQVWLMILPVLTVSSLPYQVYVQTDVRTTSPLSEIAPT